MPPAKSHNTCVQHMLLLLGMKCTVAPSSTPYHEQLHTPTERLVHGRHKEGSAAQSNIDAAIPEAFRKVPRQEP